MISYSPGRSFLVRYADDFVMGFENERDACRVLEVLPKRMEKHGLTVHPEKTRLVCFERPSDNDDDNDPGTFDFLGFPGGNSSACWSATRCPRHEWFTPYTEVA